MLSTSITPCHTYFHYNIPNNFPSKHSLHFKKTLVSYTHNYHQQPILSGLFKNANNGCVFYLSKEVYFRQHRCRIKSEEFAPLNQEQERHNNNHVYSQEMYFPDEKEKPHHKEVVKEQEVAVITHLRIRSNRWWASIKAALGQRINLEGIAFFIGILYKYKHLALPHVFVPDIRYIDWNELKKRGFEGVVFDKDNTITMPYSLNLWSPLASSMEQCKSLFGNNIAVFSNSAGLTEYDPDGRKARILERAIGIKVIRHRLKKPAGTAEEIERQFGCKSSRFIMVGDRPFTDIIYGNRNGFLTILTVPLSLSQEPFIVKQVRKLEMVLVNRWSSKGIKPINHWLLPDYQECVKDELL
ncbi:phosphatidylglycerophosphate phosphatase 1, chloroplastic/mitochondrial [Capsicum galapagoense]